VNGGAIFQERPNFFIVQNDKFTCRENNRDIPCCLSIFVLRDIQHVRTKHRETSEVHVTRRAALRVTCTTFEAYLGVSLPHGPVRCLSGRGEIPTRREIKCASPKVPKNRKVTQGLAKNTSLHNAHEHSLFVFRFHRSYSAFTTCCRSADTPILWCDLKLVRRCGALVSAVPSTRYKFEGPRSQSTRFCRLHIIQRSQAPHLGVR